MDLVIWLINLQKHFCLNADPVVTALRLIKGDETKSNDSIHAHLAQRGPPASLPRACISPNGPRMAEDGSRAGPPQGDDRGSPEASGAMSLRGKPERRRSDRELMRAMAVLRGALKHPGLC